MDEAIKELCGVIGRDLSKLHKGDTASALWPFIPNEAEYYVGKFFIKDLYSLIKKLKEKNYSNEQIAKLFGSPSKIAQYFTLFHSAKVLDVNQRVELAKDLMSYMAHYRAYVFCNENNKLKKYFLDVDKLNSNEKSMAISNKLSALLLLYLEILYPTMMRLGHEFHGVYEKEGKRIFIKEFFNLNPVSLDLAEEFPFKKIKIVEEIKGDVDLDFFNHLFQSPKKIASYVEIDNRIVQGSELEDSYKIIEEKINKIISKIKNLSRKDWFKVYGRGLFHSFDTLKREIGIHLDIPLDLFSKIDNEDFRIPIKKVMEFTKRHTRKEIEQITKNSYLKIFEENEK